MVKKAISRFPDQDLKFPESGNISSGPDKLGIGKPDLGKICSLDIRMCTLLGRAVCTYINIIFFDV